jgi:hypothetical protein
MEKNMGSLSTATFRKRKTCPSSQVLLLYCDATLLVAARPIIAEHVSSCDFCGAELQLISKYTPRGAATFQPVRVPWHLYRLAKDLLAFSANDLARSVGALYETSNFSLTDA